MAKKVKSKRKTNYGNIVVYVSLILVFSGVFYLKYSIFDRGCRLKNGEFGLFRVEEATRYRYAKLVAEGEKIPTVDRRIQYPEGLNVKKHFTTLSQRTLGLTYRLLHLKIPFYRYVIFFMFLYSSLSVFAVYGTGFLLSGSRVFSLLSTFFYATNFASSSRTIAGGLVEEDFAIPLMFFSLFFVLKAIKTGRKIFSGAAGFLIALALGGWHVSQFFYLIFVAIFIVIYAFGVSERKKTFSVFLPVFIFATIAGFSFSVLRGEFFLLSFSQLLAYSFVASHLILWKKRKFIIFISVFIVFFVFFFYVSRPVVKEHAKNYAHVYDLMLNKIKYLGNKPTFYETVKNLPFDAKVLWQASFVSPDFKFIRKTFGIVFIFFIPGFIAAVKRFYREKSADLFVIFSFLASFFVLFLLIKRLYVFVIFFLCVLIPFVRDFAGKKFLKVFIPALFSIGVFVQTRQTLPQLKPIARRINSYKQDVLKWMIKNLPEKSVILCNIGFAPEIVQNSSFSTVLHNHYEAKDIRDKTKEFYEKIYDGGETFYKFARKYGSQYFIYHWEFLIDKSVNSVRYQVDRMTIYKNSACYKFHFVPEKLKHFAFLYQNEYYRVFKVLGENEKPFRRRIRYVPFFDERIFVPRNKAVYIEGKEDKGEVFDDDYAKKVMDGVWSLPNLKRRADSLAISGNYAEAEKVYKRMLEIDPYYARTHLIMGDFYMKTRKVKTAISHFKWVVDNAPDRQGYYFLISALEIAGKKDEAEAYRKKARKLFPNDAFFAKME
ncbi:MAG: hypothetical protein J7L54_03585 [Elusimicrobia bacterium]|nr:hypothetical protein [Elusimicrobiota bacterium]